MVNLILKFVSASRAAGLRVSTSEVLDCMNQLRLVDTLDELQFATVLRSNFAKNYKDQDKFNQLYHLFFHEFRKNAGNVHPESITDQVEKLLEGMKKDLDPTRISQSLLDFLAGEPVAFLQEIRDIDTPDANQGEGSSLNMAPLIRRIEIMLSVGSMRSFVSRYLTENRNKIKYEVRQELSGYFNDRLDSAQDLLNHDKRRGKKKEKRKSYDQHLNKLGEQSFSSLTPREVAEMREVISQLVRKIKDIVTRRYAAKNRGILDVKKTLRRASKYQGVPVEIIFRKKPPRRSKIVVLCDVSSSVWSAARFMLNMLYSLQECFTRVRSFIFVAGLDEVTNIFENNEINQAIDKVLKEADIDYNAGTDYGLTFRRFKIDHMDILNKKTTLIIIGDGRTNYSNPEECILDEMREKCRRVIWLNPETERFWGYGDSEMFRYEEHCHEVRECQNLNQLVTFINDLVL